MRIKPENWEWVGWGVIGREPTAPGVVVQGPCGDTLELTGYNEGDYWDCGRFLGPDVNGIVPIYRHIHTDRQFPAKARGMPYFC